MTGNLPSRYDGESDAAPDEAPPASERSRSVALILGVLGIFGFHRFYVGRPGTAVLMALTLGGGTLWWLYDMVMILAGEFRDGEGLRVRNWNVAETGGVPGVSAQTVTQLLEQVDQLEQQVGDLAERVDFAERLLAQHRDRERLSKGG